MSILQILFIIVSFAVVKGLIINEANSTAFELPTFTPPSITFQDVPDSCGGFTDCIEYIGDLLTNVVLGVIYLILFIVELVRYIGLLTIFIAQNAFQGVDGAPDWLNLLMSTPLIAGTAIIIYKLARSGEDDA